MKQREEVVFSIVNTLKKKCFIRCIFPGFYVVLNVPIYHMCLSILKFIPV